MADRQQVMLRFTDIDKYFEGKDGIEKILKEDTGREQFIMTSTVPPMYIGLELTAEAIGKLQMYDWVVVQFQEE